MKTTAKAKMLTPLLVRRPTPQSTEGIRGYALRVDYENTVSLFRPHLRNLKSASQTLPELEAMTGKRLEVLREGLFIKNGPGQTSLCANILDYRIPAPWVCKKLKRVCPHCLKENGCMQWTWEIQIFESCLVHRCFLINRCGVCDELLSWNIGSLMKCQCGTSLCNMETVPVGPIRESLDRLLTDRLHSNAADTTAQATSKSQHLFPQSICESFEAFAALAFHIAPHISYAVNFKSAGERDEQQADLTLRLADLGLPGIEAALFSELGNQMQTLNSDERAWLLCQGALSREAFFSDLFEVNFSTHFSQFIQCVLLPAWHDVHRRWLGTVDPSWITEIGTCDPRLAQTSGANAQLKTFKSWSIWKDHRKIRLIRRLGKRFQELERRNEARCSKMPCDAQRQMAVLNQLRASLIAI